ncbi:MAG: SDR family oxidoreductase [Chloroflexi bacterium]|nr:SDR family oxidoreductase [Chloroflexota bacterium]
MKILILGGTVFLGRAIVEACAARGHEVTLFNRGQRNPDLFPELEHLRGDRDGNLEALRGRRWDAVIDPSGYLPRLVRASAELLADAVDHYTFISSISVYAGFPTRGMDENAPLGTLDDPTVEEITGESYGPLKVLCEQAVAETLPGRSLIIRPGLIVGPHDPTNRFTYWVDRVARGGDVLAPNRPDLDVQVIDVRDLAEWTVRLVERKQTGIYNATGPDYHLTLREVLETCKTTTGSDARWIWADEEFLDAQGVEEWTGLPLWIHNTPDMVGFSAMNIDRALAEGLTLRPLATTVADTLAWSQTLPADAERRAGISPEREAELLSLWRDQQ